MGTEQEKAAVVSDTIVLRWRVCSGALPLYNRYLRSLAPFDLSAPLLAWVRSRIEWAIDHLFEKDANGVLVMTINPLEDVTLAFEELREEPVLGLENLLVKEGLVTGVQLEEEKLEGVVWIEKDGKLYASASELVTATCTFAKDIMQTLKYPLHVSPLEEAFIRGMGEPASVFLISDEFGFVPIKTGQAAEGVIAQKLTECFDKLWTK